MIRCSFEISSDSAWWRASVDGGVRSAKRGCKRAIAKCRSRRGERASHCIALQPASLLHKSSHVKLSIATPHRLPGDFFISFQFLLNFSCLHLVSDSCLILLWLKIFQIWNVLSSKIVVPLYPCLRHIGLPECVVKCQYFMILLPISSSLLNLFSR